MFLIDDMNIELLELKSPLRPSPPKALSLAFKVLILV